MNPVSRYVLDFHMATEAYSPYGRYGRWFPIVMLDVPAAWLAVAAIRARKARGAHEEAVSRGL